MVNYSGAVAITGTPTSGQVPTATSGTAATWQTPAAGAALDTTAAHIVALGVQAAGANGLGADSGHVHPTTGVLLSGAAAGGSLTGTYPNPGVGTLNQSTTGNAASATAASGLTSATTTVAVSAATAPTANQVLTASSGTAASWQTPSAGGTPLGVSTGPASAISTTTKTDIGPTFTVPANTIAAGTTYELKALLSLTAAGTATDTGTWTFYWGGIAGTALATLGLSNAGGIMDTVGYVTVEGFVRFSSTTACTSCFIVSWAGPITGNGNSPINSGATLVNSTGLTTTSNEVLTIAFTYSAITGSPSITPEYASVIRVA